MVSVAGLNYATEFSVYVNKLHSSRNPLVHICSLTSNKLVKESDMKKQWLVTIKRFYVNMMLLPHNNYRTKYYHDCFDSVDLSRKEHAQYYPYILHPFSNARAIIDTLILFPFLSMKLYLCSIPGFGVTIPDDYFLYLSHILLFFGAFLITVNFFTGYSNRKMRKIVLNPFMIFRHYAFTYLLIDVGTLIPHLTHYFFNIHCQTYHCVIDLAYLLVLGRIFTFIAMIKNFFRYFTVQKRTLALIILIIKGTLTIHSTSCLLYAIKVYFEYFQTGDLIYPSDWKESTVLYINKMFKSFCRLFYTSYSKDYEQISNILIFLILEVTCTFMLAYFMAEVLIHVFAGVAYENRYIQLALEVRHFARRGYHDPVLRERMISMFDVIFFGTVLTEELVKLTTADNLRRDLNMETIGHLLDKTKYLCQLEVYLRLRIMDVMKLTILLPNDNLVTEGHEGRMMFFLSYGRLVMYREGVELGHLDDGDNYAEEALMVEYYYYPHTLQASTACIVLQLLREDYIACF